MIFSSFLVFKDLYEYFRFPFVVRLCKQSHQCLERRKILRRRRNRLITTRPDSHVSHPCLADHSSPIWSRFRFWSGEKLPKKEETYKDTQVKSKYRYMGFGLWENTDPTAPKPIKKPSPPPPPPKVMQTWYFFCFFFSSAHWIINEDIGHRNDDDDVETNSKNQGIWGAEATTITTIDPETKTSKKCKESNWSFFLLSGIFTASMMLDWIWSLKDEKYHDKYIFLEGGADHVHLHGVGDKDDLKQGAWRPHPCWQL